MTVFRMIIAVVMVSMCAGCATVGKSCHRICDAIEQVKEE